MEVYSGREQGPGCVNDILFSESDAKYLGWKYKALDIDGKKANETWNQFLSRSLGDAKFDGIFYAQHGNLSGPVNKAVSGMFAALTPSLSAYANSNVMIVATQCRGMVDAALLRTFKNSYKVDGVWTAAGFNATTINGFISRIPYDPASDVHFYGKGYVPWKKK